MKTTVRNIFICIIIFLIGLYLGTKIINEIDNNKVMNITGTYVYEVKRSVNVQTDTFLNIDSVNNQYIYYDENNEYKGKIKKVNEYLYLLDNGYLDKSVICFDDEQIVMIDKDGKTQQIYKFSDTCTEKN